MSDMDLDVLDPETRLPQLNTLSSLVSGEIDAQVATAKHYPRSIKRFLHLAESMATLNEEIAGSCLYALRRGGKHIEGPSARFAEILAQSWGNLRAEARPIETRDRDVLVRGTAWDLESNTAIAFEVTRRITNKEGQRFDDDMIAVTTNAAGSIALRNAVLKIVPKGLWWPIYLKARKTAVGDQRTLAARRADMLDTFAKLGASSAEVFALLGVEAIEEITLDHLATLRGHWTAIRDEGTTVEAVFSEVRTTPTTTTGPQRRSTKEAPAATVIVPLNGQTGSAEIAAAVVDAMRQPVVEAAKVEAKSVEPATEDYTPTGALVALTVDQASLTEMAGCVVVSADVDSKVPGLYRIVVNKKGTKKALDLVTTSPGLFSLAQSCTGHLIPYVVRYYKGLLGADRRDCLVLESIEGE